MLTSDRLTAIQDAALRQAQGSEQCRGGRWTHRLSFSEVKELVQEPVGVRVHPDTGKMPCIIDLALTGMGG